MVLDIGLDQITSGLVNLVVVIRVGKLRLRSFPELPPFPYWMKRATNILEFTRRLVSVDLDLCLQTDELKVLAKVIRTDGGNARLQLKLRNEQTATIPASQPYRMVPIEESKLEPVTWKEEPASLFHQGNFGSDSC